MHVWMVVTGWKKKKKSLTELYYAANFFVCLFLDIPVAVDYMDTNVVYGFLTQIQL